jgi:molybdate transport system ATP-binding protein
MSADDALRVRVRIDGRAPNGKAGFALDIAFDAPPGVTILFGPSGSGKSTTLAAIAGLVRVDEGLVALGGDVWLDTVKRIDRPVQKRGIAFVFQTLALFPHMTAAGNVVYGMNGALSAADKRKRAHELLERLRVPHLADRRPPTFSGGEAQRVALARAFATQPRAVLLDEPFSAMDRALRRELVADLRSFVADLGIPAVHVTHHRHEARALGDRVVMLDKGRVVKVGAIDELLPAELPRRDMTFDDTPMHPDEALGEDE